MDPDDEIDHEWEPGPPLDDPHLQRFKGAAEAYCAWVEGDPVAEDEELSEALVADETARAFELLTEVVAAGTGLRHLRWGSVSSDDPKRPEHDEWKARHWRLRTVAVGFYWTAETTLLSEVYERPEVSLGDAHDDLADVWRDLRIGLNELDAGRVSDAVFQWKTMRMHWLEHATGALNALVQHFNAETWPGDGD